MNMNKENNDIEIMLTPTQMRRLGELMLTKALQGGEHFYLILDRAGATPSITVESQKEWEQRPEDLRPPIIFHVESVRAGQSGPVGSKRKDNE